MNFKKIVLSALLLFTSVINATETSQIKLFYSNNTNQINIQDAYQRFTGKAQKSLEMEALKFMRANHINNGKQEEILGTYYLLSNHKTTADNSEIFSFYTSQKISEDRIFSIAKKIAETLNQESVAVFIPSQQKQTGDIRITFTHKKPKISEAIKMIHEKLPESYSQAFTFHISDRTVDYAHAEVDEIEWLGGKLKVDLFKNAFPQEKISSRYGRAYLIYKNGKIVPL